MNMNKATVARKRIQIPPKATLEAQKESVLPKYVIFGLISLLLLIVFASNSQAQFYFGKNKVQYTDFQWQVMTTDHFRVYFYEEEAEIAKVAASLAEDSYRDLAIKFNHEVKNLVPLIIYSSPSYFSQTNVIPGLLPESVGGFTEFMKGRVVVPFHGSYYDFKHVIQHEMVHVFTISKLKTVTSRQRHVKYFYPPLWFTEGLAEYWSKPWDPEADMVIRDMVLTNNLFTIENMYRVYGTYYMYKLGESICHFIDSTYGPDKLIRLFDNWPKGKNFNEVVSITLGDNLKEVSRKWAYSLKKKYYPQLESSDLPNMHSKPITHDGYSVRGVPISWDDGKGVKDWVVFKANRMGYSGIYIAPTDNSKKVRTLIKGERSSDFESLYLLRSGIDASDSGLVVFSSKSKETDVIYLYDLNKMSVVRRYELGGLISALSPRFSPNGKKIVFSGAQKSGYSDIYLLDLASGEMSALTDDPYYDAEPVFGLNNDQIIFVSDRGRYGESGARNLYRLDIASRKISAVSSGNFHDASPDVTSEGIMFASDRDGIYNLYLLDPDNRLSRLTDFATGAFNPRLSSDGESIVYTAYQGLRYQILEMDIPDKVDTSTVFVTNSPTQWVPSKLESKHTKSSIRYATDFSFDIAQSSIGYDPVYGSLGGIQVAMSDVLGDKAYHFLVTNTARTKDEFLESFNLGVTYINREKRINWGVGVYHLVDEYFNEFDKYYTERQIGAITLLSYPISKFNRLDWTTLSRYSNKTSLFGIRRREAFLVTNYVSWIFDNSLWDYTGPIEGRRYNLTLGYTVDFGSDVGIRSFNRMAMADIRHYYRLGMYSAFASRLLAYSSTGVEPQRIYFGGSWSFRGFDRREFYNRNIIFASHELRFPFIDNLFVGFPIGGMGFRGIRGAIFADVGSAWDNEFDQLYGSFGVGFRVALAGVVVLRFDFSRITDFETVSRDTDFDFFFGWNF